MLNDPLANALSKIMNAERRNQQECVILVGSKTVKRVLELLSTLNYVGSFSESNERHKTVLTVNLLGRINKVGAIKPRFSVTIGTYEKYEKRFLPAKGFGVLVVSTSQGVMTNEEAKEKNLGGRLLAYCY